MAASSGLSPKVASGNGTAWGGGFERADLGMEDVEDSGSLTAP